MLLYCIEICYILPADIPGAIISWSGGGIEGGEGSGVVSELLG